MYNNIFHYYRSKRDSTENLPSKQVENNVRKALINVLEHASPLLTYRFVSQFIDGECNVEEYDYLYEVGSQLDTCTSKGFIIGIAETDEISNTNSIKKTKTRPDGAILSTALSILIETKTGIDQLDRNQLEGHKDTFATGQLFESEPVIIKWIDIRNFFAEQYIAFKEDKLTAFLIDQFIRFCDYNSVGFPDKSNEHIFSHFKTMDARSLAKQLHHYLFYESHYKDEVADAHELEGTERTDCIAYINKGCSFKFLSTTKSRDVCVALHLGGRKHKQDAVQMQEQIDQMLQRRFITKSPTPGEVYIRLEWVKNLDQIKPFIDQAYYLRLK